MLIHLKINSSKILNINSNFFLLEMVVNDHHYLLQILCKFIKLIEFIEISEEVAIRWDVVRRPKVLNVQLYMYFIVVYTVQIKKNLHCNDTSYCC